MAVERSSNWLSQERVEVFDLRALESSICADFDVACGVIQAGNQPLVVTGFTISVTGTAGNPASSLLLNTAGGVCMHPLASEAGTVFQVPLTQAAEQLSATNPVVIGSFSAGIKNYVGIDLIRTDDAASADLTKFLDANTDQEIALTVPKARTLNYQIYVSQQPFSVSSNILPIAIVLTDSSNNVSTITDARNMFFRLGRGGDIPSAQAPYVWPDAGRDENPITYNPMVSTADPFAGGDKGISSLKSVLAAIQSSLWELRGGDFWYSPTNRDNVQLLYTGSVLSNGDNFSFSGSTLKWQGLKMAFENSAVTYNVIADNASTGVTILDQQCLYVDIQRDTVATLVPGVANLTALGTPVIPGTRFIIAWREGSEVYTRNKAYQTGRVFPVASASNLGIVQLHLASLTPLDPIVFSDGDKDVATGIVGLNANSQASITSTSGVALTATATGAGNHAGIVGTGIGTGGSAAGIIGNGTTSGGVGSPGIIGNGTGSGGQGVRGIGSGSGAGVSGTGGATANTPGVQGVGSGTNVGVLGTGSGGDKAGAGVYGANSGGSTPTAFAGDGVLDLSDATPLLSTTGIAQGIFAKNTNCRAYGSIHTAGGVVTVTAGVNIASAVHSVSLGHSSLLITLTTGATTWVNAGAYSYAICASLMNQGQPTAQIINPISATQFHLSFYNIIGATYWDFASQGLDAAFHIFGE